MGLLHLLLLLLLLLLELEHLNLLLEGGRVSGVISLKLLLVLDAVYIINNHLLLWVHDFLCIHRRLWRMPYLLEVYFLVLDARLLNTFACCVVLVYIRCGFTLRSSCYCDSRFVCTTSWQFLLGCASHTQSLNGLTRWLSAAQMIKFRHHSTRLLTGSLLEVLARRHFGGLNTRVARIVRRQWTLLIRATCLLLFDWPCLFSSELMTERVLGHDTLLV